MKKVIKQKTKTTSSTDKKDTRPFTTKQMGYKENVYNSEEQKNFDKADGDKKNTLGTNHKLLIS